MLKEKEREREGEGERERGRGEGSGCTRWRREGKRTVSCGRICHQLLSSPSSKNCISLKDEAAAVCVWILEGPPGCCDPPGPACTPRPCLYPPLLVYTTAMDGLRLPPVIEEVGDPADDSTDLKPDMEEQLTAKEKEVVEEKEGKELEAADGETEQDQGREEKGVKEEKAEEEEDEEGRSVEPLSEDQELEELRSQVLQLLLELGEVREVSQKHEEGFCELRGLLEDERLASAHQAETFTRQIQRLQAQLRSVQEEMGSLQEEKESELAEAQEELREAQEEVIELQQAAEEAAAERENDIASLQEELCRLRAELQRLDSTTQEYELEVTTLRAEIAMKSQRREEERREGDMGQLKQECRALREECQALKEGNRKLSERLQQLQLQRAGDAYLAVTEDNVTIGETDVGGGAEDKPTEADSYISVAAPRTNCRLVDASVQKNISFEGKPVSPTGGAGGFGEIFSLRDQLKQAEEKAQDVQKACEGLKVELTEMQTLYDGSRSDRAELERDLLRCKEELEQLMGGKAQNSTPPREKVSKGDWNPVLVVAVAAAIHCPAHHSEEEAHIRHSTARRKLELPMEHQAPDNMVQQGGLLEHSGVSVKSVALWVGEEE
ncbi:hypothetical protein SKAU_G00041500 [Synaphobranchus kaupii]|uniref:Coiled-coil domain-containing protein 136-like n=1 Tax=Synaphobranchus kaupii TaxID=118154 RepID=A0A9Q1G1D6_SYNKA|nr:hypothetical protein SKAU_G00041500 [Synaphobranchus kaupii]